MLKELLIKNFAIIDDLNIGVIGPGIVFDAGNKPDLEVEAIADGAVGHALIAEDPLHGIAAAGRCDGAARHEAGGDEGHRGIAGTARTERHDREARGDLSR